MLELGQPTSVQNNVVDHIALVFGVVKAERAAQVFRQVLRCVVIVTGLHVHGEGIPEADVQTQMMTFYNVNNTSFFFLKIRSMSLLIAGEKRTVFALE